MSVGIEHKNRIVGHSVHHQADPLLALPQGLLHPLALGDVARGGYEAADCSIVVEKGPSGKQQVAPGTVSMGRPELDLALAFLPSDDALEHLV